MSDPQPAARDAPAAAEALTLAFDEALPVSAARAEITCALREHQVIIVCGDTGSGKTTQLPKICLAAGRGRDAKIGHTQPRRIAARAVATRIAEETATVLGGLVGYKVRFDDVSAAATRVKVMTDGILLAEIRHDPELRAYDTLIIDEAHERSLGIDFLLGYLKRLLPRRPDLKLIITSATIDPMSFSRHFDDAPVIQVEGRSYPVRVEYAAEGADGDLAEQVVEVVMRLAVRPLEDLGGGTHRDMLVFLPGERFIRDAEQALRRSGLRGFEVLPLYGRLPGGQQDRVFHPGKAPRVVLTTNVAETSLTVPRIRFVIDSGLARISRYAPRSKIQRLPVEPISQASAEQRKGRCGRLAPGLCVRLYDEADLLERPAHTDSEILRTSLAAVILQMQALGLGPVDEFPFLEPPPLAAIRDGYQLLFELGAVDEQQDITRVGRQMARLPIDPRLARMLLAAGAGGVLRDVLIIVAGLAVQDPRERPPEDTAKADACHAKLSDSRSDFLFYLNLWRQLRRIEKEEGTRGCRRWCRDNFISWRRTREWQDVQLQLTGQCRAMRLHIGRAAADPVAVHRALLSGLLGLVARRDRGRSYLGARDTRLTLFPGSALAPRPPPWLMAAEIIETSRVYAATAAKVSPGWIEAAAPHLVRRSHDAAWFDAGSGRVMCHERVVLWGLVLASGRRVPLAGHDPRGAREVFIAEALVAQQLRSPPAPIAANWQLRARLEALEARLRRRDVVIGEQAEHALYDAVVPAGVHDARTLKQWLSAEAHAAQQLNFSEEVFAARELRDIRAGDYPDALAWEGNALPLSYRFMPGEVDDGISVDVPVMLLPGMSEQRLSWLVPGHLASRITALLKLLPRAERRKVVPVPDTAAALCRQAPDPSAGNDSLEAWLASWLGEHHGLSIDPRDWAQRLPPELRFNIRVLDLDGRLLAQGRELAALQARFAGEVSAQRLGDSRWERDGLRLWDFDALPELVRVRRSGLQLSLYPALVDRGASVSLRLLETPTAAARATRRGVLRLAMLRLAQQRRVVEAAIRADRELLLRYRGIGSLASLNEDVAFAAFADTLLREAREVPRRREEFEACLEACRADVVAVGEGLARQLREVLGLHAEIGAKLQALRSRVPAASVADIDTQLAALIHPQMLSETPRRWRSRLPIYLGAVLVRLDKLAHGHARDADYTAEIARQRARLTAWREAHGDTQPPDGIEEFRWLIEELRISLFAQQLGTAVKVSARRLDERWQTLVQPV